jgi:hypothetical protein
MDNGMTRKIEKAKKYAMEERDRIKVEDLRVNFSGTNNEHEVTYADGKWDCDCDYFIGRNVCTHTMALEMILENVKIEAVPA